MLKTFFCKEGLPVKMISDNAKTFKAVAKKVRDMVTDSEAVNLLSIRGVQWMYNVERAPWWGGIFEQMILTVKRCLRKMVGNARLIHEELLTAVVEVEMIGTQDPYLMFLLKISKSHSHLNTCCVGTESLVCLIQNPSLRIAIKMSPHLERTSHEE